MDGSTWVVEYQIPYAALGLTASDSLDRILGFNVCNVCFEHSLPGSVLLTVESNSKVVLPVSPAHGKRNLCGGNERKNECKLHSCGCAERKVKMSEQKWLQ